MIIKKNKKIKFIKPILDKLYWTGKRERYSALNQEALCIEVNKNSKAYYAQFATVKIVDGKRVVYNETAVKFSKYPEDPKVGEVIVTTGFQWETVDAMRYGERHSSSWCYIGKVGEGEGMSYWFDKPDQDQSVVLREMGITKSEAESYNKYCTN